MHYSMVFVMIACATTFVSAAPMLHGPDINAPCLNDCVSNVVENNINNISNVPKQPGAPTALPSVPKPPAPSAPGSLYPSVPVTGAYTPGPSGVPKPGGLTPPAANPGSLVPSVPQRNPTLVNTNVTVSPPVVPPVNEESDFDPTEAPDYGFGLPEHDAPLSGTPGVHGPATTVAPTPGASLPGVPAPVIPLPVASEVPKHSAPLPGAPVVPGPTPLPGAPYVTKPDTALPSIPSGVPPTTPIPGVPGAVPAIYTPTLPSGPIGLPTGVPSGPSNIPKHDGSLPNTPKPHGEPPTVDLVPCVGECVRKATDGTPASGALPTVTGAPTSIIGASASPTGAPLTGARHDAKGRCDGIVAPINGTNVSLEDCKNSTLASIKHENSDGEDEIQTTVLNYYGVESESSNEDPDLGGPDSDAENGDFGKVDAETFEVETENVDN